LGIIAAFRGEAQEQQGIVGGYRVDPQFLTPLEGGFMVHRPNADAESRATRLRHHLPIEICPLEAEGGCPRRAGGGHRTAAKLRELFGLA